MLNLRKNQNHNDRGPLQPMTAMQATGRTYRTTIYTQHGKVIHVDQWSADKNAHKLVQGYGNNRTTLTVKH